MTVDKPLPCAEMTAMLFVVLLLTSNAGSVSAQFNGYNCDANYHSRFPGENTEHSLINLIIEQIPQNIKYWEALEEDTK